LGDRARKTQPRGAALTTTFSLNSEGAFGVWTTLPPWQDAAGRQSEKKAGG